MNALPFVIPIIILNWNGFEDTVECLESVFKQTYKNFEVWLVDNASANDELVQLKKRFGSDPRIHFIQNATNLGFAAGCNTIMKQLLERKQYSYIALLNNDTSLDPDWLKNLLESAGHHCAGMAGSKILNYYKRDTLDNVGHTFLNTGEILPIGSSQPAAHYNSRMETWGACAGACLYSVKMLEDVGLFDPYFKTGYEDAELGVRARVLGYKCVFEPSAVVYHKVSQSIKKIRDFAYILKLDNNIHYSYFKLMPPLVLFANLPFILMKILGVTLTALFFLRFQIAKVIVTSLLHLLVKDLGKILEARKEFMKKKHISSFRILKEQEFFLFYYLKYFNRFILKGEKTVFEK